ncbi:permease [Myxococcota bacterium]|nr:permease [Myxococcota bacterium]MBU1383098.1 permease [Myxococcota bacterium]MBU1497964.1 permease [Myxococcota bacterium]
MNFLQNFLFNTWKLTSDMALWLWAGFIIAAVLHVFIGVKRIQKYMGGESSGSILRSALVGIPLPICSCGVLPVAAALRKSGAGKSPVLTFLITTPVTGVDSIAATWALMGWVFTVARLLASVLIGLAAGFLNLFFNRDENPETIEEPPSSSDSKSSFRDFISYAFVEMPVMIAGSILLGLVLGGLITTIIPPGSMPLWMTTGVGGIAISVLIAVPLYVCATGSIPVAAALLAAGFSPGAALAFLIAGPATNAVAVSTVFKILGKKAVLIYLSVITSGSFLIGLAFDFLINSSGTNLTIVPGHNHAGHISLFAKVASAALLVLLSYYYISNLSIVKNIMKHLFFQKSKGDEMGRIILEIPDMTCNHCRMNVTKTLKDIKELTSFEIDLEKKTAILQTENNFDLSLALTRLSDAGYKSTVKNKT